MTPLAMATVLAATPLFAAAAAAAAAATAGNPQSAIPNPQSAPRPPNVVLILTDDQGWGDVGFNGNPLIHTPTLDRLAAESTVMNHFYVCPLSAPTRATLLTGRYHLRTGVSGVGKGLENMSPQETTLAKIFRSNGYATGCFGKWHNGAYYPLTPNGQGFDEFLGFCCGHWPAYFDPPLQHNEQMVTSKGYITDIFTDAALAFIEKNKDKPFLCYIPYNAPHTPYQVPDSYYDKYKNIKSQRPGDQAGLAAVYAMVECVDTNIGRVLDKLDKLGLRENTIVIYMSDNGPMGPQRYNGNMRGHKGQVFEGGVRVPCVISWPGKIPARKVDEPAAHIDIWPTLKELCGLKGESAFPLDGISLATRLLGGDPVPRQGPIYTHKRDAGLNYYDGAARTQDERLCVFPDGCMLFNITKDPSEKNDIYNAKDPRHQALFAQYMSWYKEASKGVGLWENVPVGYDESPQVRIAAPEGKMEGGLKCHGPVNQNWVRNFKTEKDALRYTLTVVAEADYEIALEYANPEDNPQARFTVTLGDEKLSAPIPVFHTKQLPAPDRIPRKEAYLQTWGRLSLGKVHLKKGTVPLTLYATNINNRDAQNTLVKTILVEKQK